VPQDPLGEVLGLGHVEVSALRLVDGDALAEQVEDADEHLLRVRLLRVAADHEPREVELPLLVEDRRREGDLVVRPVAESRAVPLVELAVDLVLPLVEAQLRERHLELPVDRVLDLADVRDVARGEQLAARLEPEVRDDRDGDCRQQEHEDEREPALARGTRGPGAARPEGRLARTGGGGATGRRHAGIRGEHTGTP
jgi:hypothetical protein